ncbi:histidine--tRNA ligase [Luteibaculum oceani]|uniref:Histidine--tRNA ligase n=1 Tax=Luteibaculum oceani TaxID=1294296 RepID=A0A5C6VCZ3_9FLAO|nr:histidine--tRNA ligase [Luteibaculum oceani]TXC81485.1 histidine--tRNA ligase [Luteibaculum oceani]
MKPSIPKGTRDFIPADARKREYIFSTIKKHFKSFGYQPIETPAMENLSTLTGKYGEEGDRLIFKILNSGDYLKKADKSALANEDSKSLISSISEKALRYDLTVPFARFVVQHQNELTFPFKRYQIQPVWRADRPQKGRYREFFQCDADVVGSESLWYEVELMLLFDRVLTDLKLPGFTIKINNRKVLSGLAELIGQPDKIVDFTVALDKLDKIGRDKVIEEMLAKGLDAASLEKAYPIFDLPADPESCLEKMRDLLKDSAIGLEGLKELEFVYTQAKLAGIKKADLALDFTLARGLDYYTGAIFEVKAHEVQIGSICGGGRYDDLTGVFGQKGLSGVGISFGADRIYDVLEALELFPKDTARQNDVLICYFEDEMAPNNFSLCTTLRDRGVSAVMYPENAKLKKQMKYANDNDIPFVVLAGDKEWSEGLIQLKNMETGEQTSHSKDDLILTIAKYCGK